MLPLQNPGLAGLYFVVCIGSEMETLKLKIKKKPTPMVIMVSDPNSDADDMLSFAAAAALADKNKLKLSAVITTGGDFALRLRRAKLTKGCFIALGHPFQKVCAGCDYTRPKTIRDDCFVEEENSLALERNGNVVLRNSRQLLAELFKKADPKSITLILNAQVSDVNIYLRECGAKILKKVSRIILMGGLAETLDEKGRLQPDLNCYNFKVAPEAVKELFRWAQDNKIRLVLVPRETAYQVPMDRSFYNQLSMSSHPVARAVVNVSRLALENLWNDIRRGSYSHFDIRRFAKVFMGMTVRQAMKEISSRDAFEIIEPKIRHYYLYDVLTVLAADDPLFRQFVRLDKKFDNYPVFRAEIIDPEKARQVIEKLIFKKLEA